MLLLLSWGCAPPDEPPRIVVSRGDLDVHVTVKGELEAFRFADVRKQFEGWTEVVYLVEHGATVEAGEVVVRLEPSEYSKNKRAKVRDTLAKTLIELDTARAQMELELREAEQAILEAELDAALAAKRQTDSPTVPRVEREQARVDALKAASMIASSRSNRDRLRVEWETKIRLLELEVAHARTKLKAFEKYDIDRELVAPIGGTALVVKRRDELLQVGDTVYGTYYLVRIPDTSSLKVVGWIHETDSPFVREEQPATIFLDARPGISFGGRVSAVAPIAVPHGETEEKHLEVELELDNTLPEMKPGMSVTADIVVGSYDDALLVPTDVIMVGPDGPFVFLPDGTEAPIGVLGENDGMTAILGLEEGMEVLTYDPEAWSRGERIPQPDEPEAAE